MTYRPDPRILELGERFYDEVKPADFPERTLRFRNDRAAEAIGVEGLVDEEWEAHFARFLPLPRNLEKPLALRYHGHQFGAYNSALGDGRGFLFAQVRDEHGRLLDLGTKGSGTTPWSRGGDGRLTLKGGVREVLATSMLEALGVKTSRTLSLFETGEKLQRGDEPSPTRSSVLVRLGHSHLRYGTFQRFANVVNADGTRGDTEARERLIDYAVRMHFPDLVELKGTERVVAFLARTGQGAAKLAAEWMTAGFCHGVLNTDNMTVTADSFDYGPYRFVPTGNPDFVAAYFDHSGLYAFGRQPSAVQWNLERLADTLRSLAPGDQVDAALSGFEDRYADALIERTIQRLGVASKGLDADTALSEATWTMLATSKVGFEQMFFDLFGGRARAGRWKSGPMASLYGGREWDTLRELVETREPASDAITNSPYFRCDSPCTLLIDEIEGIWSAIAKHDDWAPFNAKVAEIRDLGKLLALPRRL